MTNFWLVLSVFIIGSAETTKNFKLFLGNLSTYFLYSSLITNKQLTQII